MAKYLMNLWPVMLSFLACAANATLPDVIEDQIGSKNSEQRYPFIAILVNLDAMCSAAILSTSWMISSSHCYTKSGRRSFLAYAGSSDLTGEKDLQVRCAEVAVWADPVSGAVTQEASERSQLMLLKTSAPWTVDEAVRPVAIGELPPSPWALEAGSCVTAGFDLNKNLAVAFCDGGAYWNEDGQVYFSSYSSEAAPMAPGLLLYCHSSDTLVGVGLSHCDLPTNNMDGSPSVKKLCFTYLGGDLLKSLQHIVNNNSVMDDVPVDSVMKTKMSRDHLEETNHMVTFIATNRTANQIHTISNSNGDAVNENHEDVEKDSWLEITDFNDDTDQNKMMVTFIATSRTANEVHTISNSNDTAVNENHEDVGKDLLLEKTDFNDDLGQNEMVLDYQQRFKATSVDAMWALVLVPVLLAYMVVSYWTTMRKLARRLYRSARRKNDSRNNECP